MVLWIGFGLSSVELPPSRAGGACRRWWVTLNRLRGNVDETFVILGGTRHVSFHASSPFLHEPVHVVMKSRLILAFNAMSVSVRLVIW